MAHSGIASPHRRGERTARLVLVRHGETEWSRTGRHTSTTDLPLTAIGEEQAREVGRALRRHVAEHPFALVLCSPRRRAIHTAELAGFGDALVVADDLAEWDYGDYEGLTSAEIVAQRGSPWNLWDDGVPEGSGESRADVRRRSAAVIDRVLPVLDSGDDVLVVAHGHILRAVAATWLGLQESAGAVFSLATGTLSELGFEHDRRVVTRWNNPPA